MSDEFEKIVLLNKKYTFSRNRGQMFDEVNFKIIKGNIPVLISAPHSVECFRNGYVKSSDRMTGGIAEYLCEKYGLYGITRTFCNNDDPNYYNTGISLEYKKAVIDLINSSKIEFMFDIHGCNDGHDFEIEIGTNNGENLNRKDRAEIAENILSETGIVFVDSIFKASSPETVSCYVHKNTDIDCFQIEICHAVRDDPERLLHFIDTFMKLIFILKEDKKKKKSQDNGHEESLSQ